SYPENFSVGQVIQINLKAEWSDGSTTTILPTDINYKSSREDRAVVSNEGKLTALARGKSYIDLIYQGKTFRTLVTINPAPILVDLYLEASLPLKLNIGNKYTISGIKAKWSDGSITDVLLSEVTINSSRADRIQVTSGELEAI